MDDLYSELTHPRLQVLVALLVVTLMVMTAVVLHQNATESVETSLHATELSAR